MLRTLTGIGFALALVGTAHAQDQVTVKLDGKTPRAIRAEIYRAAEKVCANAASSFDPVDSACIDATYTDALRQLRATPRFEQTAYSVQARPIGLR